MVRYVLQPERSLRASEKRRRLHWRAVADRVVLVVGAGSVFAVALMMSVSPGRFGGRGAKAAAGTDAGVIRALAKRSFADSPAAIPPVIPGSRRPEVKGIGSWGEMVRSSYVNPLVHARVIPERIDQGVDYAGSGTLTALGAGRITYVAMFDTGWPGAFIEYRLLGGPDAGRYVYYAEGVNPAPGLRVGEKVRAGQPVASIIPGWYSGVEIGWGAGIGTTSYAANMPGWDGSVVTTTAGKKFSSLIAALGGPPGRVEG
jgi:hypothetical protein